MRFHWGHGLALGMIGFIAYISYLVISAMMVDFDLETEDYYAKELQFQNQIDKSKNYSELDSEITLVQQGQNYQITMPHVADSGSIYFYRPSDKKLDRRYALSLAAGLEQRISTNDLQKGRYQLRVEWIKGNIEYYFEKNIFIQ